MNTPNTERHYTVDNVRVGNIIKEACNNLRMTQEQLSEVIDVTPGFVGHLTRGDRSLSLTTLVNIANTLKIPIQNFFADTDQTPDEKTLNNFAQLIEGRSNETKQAVLDIVRTVLQYLD